MLRVTGFIVERSHAGQRLNNRRGFAASGGEAERLIDLLGFIFIISNTYSEQLLSCINKSMTQIFICIVKLTHMHKAVSSAH